MDRRIKISKLLAFIIVFSCKINAKAVNLNRKPEPTETKQTVDKDQDVDKKYIVQECIELNNKIIKMKIDFINFYNSLHEIKSRIDDWYEKIEDSDGFDEVKKNVCALYMNKGIKGGNIDYVRAFYETLSDAEKKKFDKDAKNFKNELLKIIKEQDDILNNYGYSYGLSCYNGNKIGTVVNEFDELYSLSKDKIPNEIKEILEIQKIFVLKLNEDFDKIVDSINQWKEFLYKKNFYEHNIYGGCMLPYDEDWLEHRIKNDSRTEYFKQEKLVMKNLNQRLIKTIKNEK